MKKTVKSLIIAASVAAIAGIGAVSFAAWSGGAKTTHTPTDPVQVGHVSMLSFATENTATVALDGLLPYDQIKTGGTAVTPSATNKTLGSVTFGTIVTTGYDNAKYAINVQVTPTDTDGIAWTGSDSKKTDIYVSATAPMGAVDLDTWTKVNVEDGNSLEFATTVTAPVIYVIMDSDDNAQMDKKFTLTFTLEEVAD